MLSLPFTFVTSMEDVQANFEQIGQDGVGLSSLSNPAARKALLAALGVGGGSGTFVTNGSGFVAITVTHGLAVTPVATSVSTNNAFVWQQTAATSTTFSGNLYKLAFTSVGSAVTWGADSGNTYDYFWIAKG